MKLSIFLILFIKKVIEKINTQMAYQEMLHCIISQFEVSIRLSQSFEVALKNSFRIFFLKLKR